jgi:clan AA aspartic protease (TIGR02281 family)
MHRSTTTILLMLLLACGTVQAESIPLIREHGTYLVPVTINGKVSINFMIDTGASDVSIPADVFSTLVRAGTVTKQDFLGRQQYELADGSKQWAQRFRIRSLRVGTLELRDVVASVTPAAGTLLLGQSFLERLPNWTINNQKHTLVMNESANNGGTTSSDAQPVDEGTRPKWALISTFEGKTLYIDMSQIESAGSVRRTWLWLIFGPHAKPLNFDGQLITSSLFFAAFDCAANTMRYEAMTTYRDRIEHSIPVDDIPAKQRLWEPVEPGSYDDVEMRMACSNGSD